MGGLQINCLRKTRYGSRKLCGWIYPALLERVGFRSGNGRFWDAGRDLDPTLRSGLTAIEWVGLL